MEMAGHIARIKDNRWTIRSTEWTPRNANRKRGGQRKRWRDDIEKYFIEFRRKNRRHARSTWSQMARQGTDWKRLEEGYDQHWTAIS